MTDPYRDSAELRGCPMCGAPWDVTDQAPTVCPHDCGVWMTMAYLASIIDLRKLTFETSPGWFYRGGLDDDDPYPCPGCGERMKLVWVKNTPVHQCEHRHGLWIRAKYRDAFSSELAEPLEHQRRIATLRQQLASGAVDEVAAHIVALEDRIKALERGRG